MEHRNRSPFSILAVASLVAATAFVSTNLLAQKVYRWVDEDGNVHYTESLPPGYKDSEEGHDVLNEHGVVVDEDLKLTPEAREEVKIFQHELMKWDGPATAAKFLQDTFG